MRACEVIVSHLGIKKPSVWRVESARGFGTGGANPELEVRAGRAGGSCSSVAEQYGRVWWTRQELSCRRRLGDGTFRSEFGRSAARRRSLLASLAPPPPFGVLPRFATAPRGRDLFAPRPLPPSGYSPVSLPLHGGEIRSLRAPSPLRGTPPFRYRSTGERSVRSRLFGVVPPFRYRSTGERSVRSAPPPPSGVLPRFATAPRGRDPFAPRPLPPSGYSPVSLPLHGGEIRSLAPPPPFGVLPRFATAPRGRSVRSRPLPPSGYSPVSLPLHWGEIRSLAPLRGSPPVSLPLHGGEIRSLARPLPSSG